jgi:tRNA1(Val) A37 N6-methylase TrmN6
MRQRKLERSQKRQRGQFMTPERLAEDIVESIDMRGVRRILEPSCGNGSFVRALSERIRGESCSTHVVGIEIDSGLFAACRASVAQPDFPGKCELVRADFFRLFLDRRMSYSKGAFGNPLTDRFDLIVGNPPFGGSFPPEIEDELDALLGSRNGWKIKKESYAFFIVACTELLRPGGRLVFICSDSLLTIPTMTGLRQYLMQSGQVTLHRLEEFSSETNYPMLVLEYVHGAESSAVHRFGEDVALSSINATPNLSWGVTEEIARLFEGPKLGDFFVASSGMTTGKNAYFVREIKSLSENRLPEGGQAQFAPKTPQIEPDPGGSRIGSKDDDTIEEPYRFRFHEVPVSVEYELERARLNKLPAKRLRELKEAEERGDVERRVSIEPRDKPEVISLPHADYRPYNKACGRIVYCPPTHVIYWKDDGDAVLTYKKTGNWYLRGVGGQPFFGREGLTWQLVASRFVPRYLPPGYILDSGAPCAFTRAGVDHDELLFVIGWLLSPLS